jgi:hypothetical protein
VHRRGRGMGRVSFDDEGERGRGECAGLYCTRVGSNCCTWIGDEKT